MRLRLSTSLLALALLAGCAGAPRHPAATATLAAPATAATTVAANDNLNAVAWSQTAIEHDLIYLQTYRDAQARLLAAMKDRHWDALAKDDRVVPAGGLQPAVVLDIDETVLDNSPYQARLVRSGGEYNEADWAEWCRQESARALPGVVEFTQFAAKHGIAVLYVSNRARDLDQVTLANLRKVDLPVFGPQAFLGLGTFVEGCEQVGTEKGCRRQLISRKYRVLMQFGDQIGDFVTVLANNAAGRQRAMAPYMSWIGSRWFVLPNATYGSWEPALFNNDWSAPPEQRRRQKIDALRYE
ncbi:acid phosphatase [Rhodanobacter denitrificans]|uniref:5'-nucleotidase, lipoprotein e(P4) family n=1 Tax=Rhodanobacter denitrificans TaxID=666685 RepID=UPI000260DDD0|nr:HAD family acid phosphatase [Rhodanobacter denitrificans]EIL99798.1 5'-nucleotidase [Rhodanobacter denitrificans]UJJ57089.1 acid phosphatase [Rhodanobacter denitrificans]UJM90961.1 acid phosphatase [Rhodanobacter denitrificans]